MEATDKETYRRNHLNWIRANASKTVLASLTKYCEGLRIADNFIFEAFSKSLSTSSHMGSGLQSLTIDFDLNEKDVAILYSLSHHFSALQSIEFRDCEMITDEILIPIVSSCKRLKSIKFILKYYHLNMRQSNRYIYSLSRLTNTSCHDLYEYIGYRLDSNLIALLRLATCLLRMFISRINH